MKNPGTQTIYECAATGCNLVNVNGQETGTDLAGYVMMLKKAGKSGKVLPNGGGEWSF